jgi:hypothetical protein
LHAVSTCVVGELVLLCLDGTLFPDILPPCHVLRAAAVLMNMLCSPAVQQLEADVAMRHGTDEYPLWRL